MVRVQWRDLKFIWKMGEELWPPSIDTFYFLRTLEEHGFFNERISSLLDLGSGTGCLGIAAAVFNRNIRRVSLADWLLTPALYGQLNWQLNKNQHRIKHQYPHYKQSRPETQVNSLVGLHTTWLGVGAHANTHDAVLCNPPYLPKVNGFEDVAMKSTVFGTDLLEHLLKKHQTIARKVYVQFSNLAMIEARNIENENRIRLRAMGKSHPIPFRVRHALDAPNYLASLVNNRGLEVRQGFEHRYWHTIQAYQVEGS